jgi:hypothetical protein
VGYRLSELSLSVFIVLQVLRVRRRAAFREEREAAEAGQCANRVSSIAGQLSCCDLTQRWRRYPAARKGPPDPSVFSTLWPGPTQPGTDVNLKMYTLAERASELRAAARSPVWHNYVMLCYGAPSTARQLCRRQLGVVASSGIINYLILSILLYINTFITVKNQS